MLPIREHEGVNGDIQQEKAKSLGPACKRCRVKKIKCDRKSPCCTQCSRGKFDCEFDTLPKRKRKSPQRSKNIDSIEERIKQLEGIIKDSGLLTPEDTKPNGKKENLVRRASDQESDIPGDLDIDFNDYSPETESTSNSQDDGFQANLAPQVSDQVPDGIPTLQACQNIFRGFYTIPEYPDPALAKNDSLESRNRFSVLRWDKLPTPLSVLFQPKGVACFLDSGEPVHSLWSPSGIQWMRARSRASAVHSMIKEVVLSVEKKLETKTLSIFSYGSQATPFHPFPSRKDTLVLLDIYFATFNSTSPLFDRIRFMERVQQQFRDTDVTGPAWFACLNVAISLGYQCVAMLGLTNQLDVKQSQSEKYLKNAMTVIPDLLVQPPCLMSVQALVGMAMMCQVSGRFDASFQIIGIAARQLHQLGLDEVNTGRCLVQNSEQEIARCVFRLAFCVDTEFTMQNGCCSSFDDIGYDIDMPPRGDTECIHVTASEQIITLDVFRSRVFLAAIQGRIQRQLFLLRSRDQIITEIIPAVQKLHIELEEWKIHLPANFRPPEPLPDTPSIPLFPVALIQLQYYGTAMALHNLSITCAYRLADLSFELRDQFMFGPGLTQISASMDLCIAAARGIIGLIKWIRLIPGRMSAVNWLNLHLTLSAFSTIFAYILSNPGAATVQSDLELLHAVVVAIIEFEQRNENANPNHPVLKVCQAQEDIARHAIQQGRNYLSYEPLLQLDDISIPDAMITEPSSAAGTSYIDPQIFNFPLDVNETMEDFIPSFADIETDKFYSAPSPSILSIVNWL